MLITPDWTIGDKHLIENAPEFAPLIEKFSPCTLQPEAEERFFEILVRGIVAQQLPPDVVNQICEKMDLHFNKVEPEKILAASDQELSALGLVQQKIIYLQNFSQMVLDGKIELNRFSEMTDAEITKQLLEVKGLGQWTIDMFLLLALCRTDVVPTADHIFQKALKNLYNLPNMPKRGAINKIAANWRPWRSLAVWYLWRSADTDNSSAK
ncbi:MAG TPA: DNA-3-methyladenine glycosylase 2 family protein [Candidatus Avacidaminococcus intestinavium]|uniref:DNA-3-methyladenine glycosylase II n=1 Tax=Candidatus Avacidaminococcus intestinavium TaxID=2840684 RepID=A0A9D1MQJ8_9FIRM|nr:DNA-3-methyladenine glycosylase 2 family protein [Candidatus Avacidaminococcus intestinavium]